MQIEVSYDTGGRRKPQLCQKYCRLPIKRHKARLTSLSSSQVMVEGTTPLVGGGGEATQWGHSV